MGRAETHEIFIRLHWVQLDTHSTVRPPLTLLLYHFLWTQYTCRCMCVGGLTGARGSFQVAEHNHWLYNYTLGRAMHGPGYTRSPWSLWVPKNHPGGPRGGNGLQVRLPTQQLKHQYKCSVVTRKSKRHPKCHLTHGMLNNSPCLGTPCNKLGYCHLWGYQLWEQ